MAVTSVNIPLLAAIPRIVRDAITNNTDGLRDEVARQGGGWSNQRTVDPNPDGSWPLQPARPAGGIITWRRYITATTLAPIPTTADGYRQGDYVYPIDTNAGTMLFSDSFVVAANTDFTSRTGDAYAGGAAPTWAGDLSQAGPTGGRVRVLSTLGLDLYSDVWCRATAPTLPASGSVRFTFDLTALPANNIFNLPLRASAYNSTARTALQFKNAAGTLQVAVDDTVDGTYTLGQATYTAGMTVTVTVTDTNVTVATGGTALPVGTLPARYPRLTELVFAMPGYHSASFKNVKVETL